MTDRDFTYIHSEFTNPPGLVISSFPSGMGVGFLFKSIAVGWQCDEQDIEFVGDRFKVNGEFAGWVSGDGVLLSEAAE